MAVKKTVKRTVTTGTRPKSNGKKTQSSGKKAGSRPKSAAGTSKGASKPASNGKKTAARKSVSELNSILEELSDQEVNWLITQAKTMVYNHKVEEVNKAARELVETKKKKSGPDTNKRRDDNKVAIEQTGNGKSFVLILGSKRLFLSLQELKELVRLSQLTDSPANAAKRIYAWMERERKDMVNDAGVAGPGDPRLPLVFNVLREKFTVG